MFGEAMRIYSYNLPFLTEAPFLKASFEGSLNVLLT